MENNDLYLVLENKDYEIVNGVMDLKEKYILLDCFMRSSDFYESLYDDKTFMIKCKLHYPIKKCTYGRSVYESNRLKIETLAYTYEEKNKFLSDNVPLYNIFNEIAYKMSDNKEIKCECFHSLINYYTKENRKLSVEKINQIRCDRSIFNLSNASKKWTYEMVRYALDIRMEIEILELKDFVNNFICGCIFDDFYCILTDALESIDDCKLKEILNNDNGHYKQKVYKRLGYALEYNEKLKEDDSFIKLLEMFK